MTLTPEHYVRQTTARTTLQGDLLTVVLASLAIGLLAQVAIPIGPVPVTGQTLGVLAAGAFLGSRRGTLAVLLYLAQGISGLPVFAGGTAGMIVLAGPTAGYLVGFLPATWLIGFLIERAPRARLARYALALTAGTAVIYLCGSLWLARFVGWSRVIALGVLPFLAGDLLKVGIVTMGRGSTRRRL